MVLETKYIDGKEELQRLCLAAETAGYNRQIDFELMLKHENTEDWKDIFPIVFSMPHEHKNGVLSEPHVRVILHCLHRNFAYRKLWSCQLDMSTKDYLALPKFSQASKGE